MMIKEDIKKIFLVLLGLLLLTSLFYWFYVRKEMIRKDCYIVAINAKTDSKEGDLLKAVKEARGETLESPTLNKKEQNNIYRGCLVGKGLEPESLFVNLE